MTTTFSAGSEIISTLESVYAGIRERHPELPAKMMLITGSGESARGLKWGHFWRERWSEKAPVQLRHVAGGRSRIRIIEKAKVAEMMITGERLSCGAELTLQTMLHECAHALAHARGIDDCASNGRHNKEFKRLAEEMGLRYPESKAHPTLGYSSVVLADGTAEKYADEIAKLNAPAYLDTLRDLGLISILTGGGIGTGGDGTRLIKGTRKGPDRNYLKCVCGCGDVIRMSRKQAEKRSVICGECGEKFEPED